MKAYAGSIGGKTTAKRGSEYFRQLQARRKSKSGGRPPLGQTVIRPAYLVDLDTTTGHVRAWSGIGSLFWGGSPANEFLGVGELGKISVIPETRDIRAEGILIQLSGIPSDMVSLALNEAQPGRDLLVYIAMFTDAGVLIVDPYLAWSGMSDSVSMVEGAQTSTIEIAGENELARLQRANPAPTERIKHHLSLVA